jgi:SAM-dependent methyltransferase
MKKVHSAGEQNRTLLALFHEEARRGLNFSVYEADEMFQHLYHAQGRSLDTALAVYFGSGSAIWKTLSAVLRWRFGSLDRVGSVLDFASGFGRSTRFAVTEIPADRVWAAEIQSDALEAIREELGAHVLVSPEDPTQFDPARRFHAVVVSSLFTHLPEERFGQWLEKLASVLEPDGVLAFSTHGGELASEPVPEDGFLFQRKSESGKLDLAQYGSTFVTERFVGGALARHCPGWSWKRFPRGLAAVQDLYVAVAEEGCDFEALELPRTLDHFVEYFEVDLVRNLRCIGWLADREKGEVPGSVELRVEWEGGSIVASGPLTLREPYRVAEGELFPRWGYDLGFRLPIGWDPSSRLICECVFGGGARVEVWSGTLSDALLRNARLQLVWASASLEQRPGRDGGAERAGERGEGSGTPSPERRERFSNRLRAAWRRLRGT